MTGRWGPSEEALAAGRRLKEFPGQFGPSGRWQRQSEGELDPTAKGQLQPAAAVLGRYTNRETGQSVQVTILVGRAAPMSVHTPEVCLSSQAYDVVEQRREAGFPDDEGNEHRLWYVTFRARNLQNDVVRVYYGWTTGGSWVAAENPRLEFMGRPYLYKIQLSGQVTPSADPSLGDPCRQFLEDLLPALKPYLISTDSS
jgi:hypothetical protein